MIEYLHVSANVQAFLQAMIFLLMVAFLFHQFVKEGSGLVVSGSILFAMAILSLFSTDLKVYEMVGFGLAAVVALLIVLIQLFLNPGRPRDAYDDAIDWLTANPVQISQAWLHGYSSGDPELRSMINPAAFLFGGLGESRSSACGCPIAFRDAGNRHGTGTSLPSELLGVVTDKSIPRDEKYLTVDSLPRFAYWQRKADQIYNRPAPVWSEPCCTS